MDVHLIAVGERMPGWLAEGYREYARRLSAGLALRLVEIGPGRRAKGGAARAVADEGARLLAAVPTGARVVALDVRGEGWSTEALAERLGAWQREARPVALLVGGPDGLDAACLARAETRWSLSPLTFPHLLVRLLVAEQLYRAWSLRAGHPYHRGAHGTHDGDGG